jgi:hypothetical protein
MPHWLFRTPLRGTVPCSFLLGVELGGRPVLLAHARIVFLLYFQTNLHLFSYELGLGSMKRAFHSYSKRRAEKVPKCALHNLRPITVLHTIPLRIRAHVFSMIFHCVVFYLALIFRKSCIFCSGLECNSPSRGSGGQNSLFQDQSAPLPLPRHRPDL